MIARGYTNSTDVLDIIKENVRDCSISTVITSDVDYPAFNDIITV